jgi:hypothetical protein
VPNVLLRKLLIPVLVSIWNSQDTEVDSLFLRFYGTHCIQVYLEVPGGSWPPINFQRTSDGKGASFEVDDSGVQGTGTVTLYFLPSPVDEQHIFCFEARFSMRKKLWYN